MRPPKTLLGLLLFLVVLPGQTGAEDGPLTIRAPLLERLTEEARTNHPGLEAARLRSVAARSNTGSIRLWGDPMLQIGGSQTSSEGPNLEMEGDLQVMVQQPLPLFGKATAARREAVAGEAVAEASTALRFQLLRRAIVQAVQQLALDDATLHIGAEDLELFGRMERLARERQKAGLDSGLELIRVENEQDKRRQQQVTDQLRRDFDRVSLNRLLGRPIAQPFPEVQLPEIAPGFPMSEELLRLGTRFEPRLQVMRKEIAMADAGAEVTRRGRHPDVSLGLATRQWSGSGELRMGMVFASLNLPWFNRGKYRADIDRDRAKADSLRAEAVDYELDVRQELFRVWTRIDAARREADLYQSTVIPRSRLAVDTALAAWGAGRAMYLEVHEARRMLVEARLMHARAVVEQHQMIADLITCCGLADLDSLLMIPTAPDPVDARGSSSSNP